jgi:DNA-directed RNA polymerase subunit alpha
MLWKGFQRPKRLEFERETLTDRFGRFYAQPFERGFGTTIGNALRRVLLSSIEGAAITAGEDRRRAARVLADPRRRRGRDRHHPEPEADSAEAAHDQVKTLTVKIDKPGEVRGRDIQADGDVEILEPDAHIATVSEHGKLHMEMRMKRGRGYVSADKNFDEDLGIGWIPIDSVHSPVKKVNYLVEAARLGQTTDYDKLTVDVWTNGSINPRDAVSLAVEAGPRSPEHLHQPRRGGGDPGSRSGCRRAALRREQRKPRQVGRGARALRPLVQLPEEREHPDDPRAGQQTEAEMLKTKNFGRKSLNEIKEILQTMGLGLGMRVDQPAGASQD